MDRIVKIGIAVVVGLALGGAIARLLGFDPQAGGWVSLFPFAGGLAGFFLGRKYIK